MNLNQYFDKRIRSLAADLQPVEFDSWNKNKLVLVVEFFTIQIQENFDIFVPTGSKGKPHGIANVHDAYVLFIKKGKVYLSLHVSELKQFIKGNYKTLKRGLDGKDDPVEGYWINLSRLLPLRTM